MEYQGQIRDVSRVYWELSQGPGLWLALVHASTATYKNWETLPSRALASECDTIRDVDDLTESQRETHGEGDDTWMVKDGGIR